MKSESENQNVNTDSPNQTEDDVVEISDASASDAVTSDAVAADAAAALKRKLNSHVWNDFVMLHVELDKKPRCAGSASRRRGDLNRCEMLFANEAEDLMKELDEYENDGSFIRAKKTQLELYLEEPKIDRKTNLDVLDFWKENQFRYPELAAMACDILFIPITTVASEAAFSTGGRVLNKYRTALLPENAETLICLRDWLYAAAELKIEELCEDILNLNLDKDGSKR